MELNKSTLLQKQVKDNFEDLQSEFCDMKNWEKMMKQKEQELLNEYNEQQILPPVRSKIKKSPVTKESKSTENPKRIKSYDFASWDKFDDQACNDLEGEAQPNNSKITISKDQLEENHRIAMEYKEKGNCFVQQKKWDKAIALYSKAIEISPFIATFYANRAHCYLKQDNLYSAEQDCSFAIQINDTYVKAYHRRATARIGLKKYKEAKQDIEKILILEPSNKETKTLLIQVNKQLENSKTDVSKEDIIDDIPIEEKVAKKILAEVKSNKEIIDTKENNNKNNINIKSTVKPTTVTSQETKPYIPYWLPEKDNVKILKLVGKPPHLRSKEPFKKISIQEADLTKPFEKEINTCITVKELLDIPPDDTVKCKESVTKSKPELGKDISENHPEVLPIPKSAVQFLTNWRKYISSDFRYKYLKQLPSGSLPNIFQDSMESNIFSDILTVLKTKFIKRQESIFSYLKDLSNVRRFRALIMFTSNSEKQDLKHMFLYCETFEKIPEEELAEVRNKYEI
ncbi:RNA polymerase II-associated protein 3 isoform X2 [Harpegnathos saltator]|uniref:RNA polymerase II-associated protein 3 isoform X2 n=1 Tax=Harpegnathos saltator TaxID=610380 RepID=UPI000590DBED|nr:RNA polymerase II-associated protein 3 isoform X2 [Harpegnathos saltator]